MYLDWSRVIPVLEFLEYLISRYQFITPMSSVIYFQQISYDDLIYIYCNNIYIITINAVNVHACIRHTSSKADVYYSFVENFVENFVEVSWGLLHSVCKDYFLQQ